MDARAQFWDTSAFVSLLYQEPYTERAMAARAVAQQYLAWDWLVLESWSAMARRGASERQRRTRQRLLRHFALQALGEQHRAAVQKQISHHRLRSADAAHFLCLKQARRILPGLVFVCCDQELVRAAKGERIDVWE